MAKPPLNYTTKVPARRTAAECVELLAEAGADAVACQYRERQPVGLSFRLTTPEGPRDFTMPVNVDGVHQMLVKANKAGEFRSDGYRVSAYGTRDHAANVAWRVVRDWLEAQLAIIAAEMATLDEVMLPYLQVSPGRTLWEEIRERGQLPAIGGPDGD